MTPASVFETGIREAIGAGGCCASRCIFAGCLLGIYFANQTKGLDFMPHAWCDKADMTGQASQWANLVINMRNQATTPKVTLASRL